MVGERGIELYIEYWFNFDEGICFWFFSFIFFSCGIFFVIDFGFIVKIRDLVFLKIVFCFRIEYLILFEFLN